jgi:hypothetical protein
MPFSDNLHIQIKPTCTFYLCATCTLQQQPHIDFSARKPSVSKTDLVKGEAVLKRICYGHINRFVDVKQDIGMQFVKLYLQSYVIYTWLYLTYNIRIHIYTSCSNSIRWTTITILLLDCAVVEICFFIFVKISFIFHVTKCFHGLRWLFYLL